MPEIGTYPLFESLVDNDTLLGVSSGNGETRRASVGQLREHIVTSHLATSMDLFSSSNQFRLMTIERSKELVEDVYVLPKRVASQQVTTSVSNIVVDFADLLLSSDVWITFNGISFNYNHAASASIRMDVSYDNGATYPTNIQTYMAIFGTTIFSGSNYPLLFGFEQNITNPVIVNLQVRIFGGGAANGIRMYEWRGSARYHQGVPQVLALQGAYTTNSNQPRITRVRLYSGGNQQITAGTVRVYRSNGFF